MTEKWTDALSARTVKREWPIVLVAVLVALALAFATARQAPSTTYTGSQRVVVLVPVAALPNPPKAESVVAAATQSGLIASIEETLGIAPGSLRGKVTAKLDPTDKSVAIITLKAPSQAEAEAWLAGVTKAVIGQAGARLDSYVAAQEQSVEDMEARGNALRTQVEAMQRRMNAAKGDTRALYEQAFTTLQSQLFATEDAERSARLNAASARSLIFAESPNFSSSSTGGLRVGRILQGLVIGLLVGLLVAAAREWWLRRRETA